MTTTREERAREDAAEELTLIVARVEFYVQRLNNPQVENEWRELKQKYGWNHTKIPLYDILLFCQTHFGVGIDGLAAYTRLAPN